MSGERSDPAVVRFGVFTLDLRARELRKQGRRVHLQDKPFDLLAALVERPGELVSRDELRRRLWPADTFVVFDDSLNTAVRKAREALGDVPGGGRFIETLPRHGYRFLAALTAGPFRYPPAPATVEPPPREAPAATISLETPLPAPPPRRVAWRAAAGIAVAVVVGLTILETGLGRHVRASNVRDYAVASGQPVRFRVTAPPGTYFPGGSPQAALSPDGRRIAFLAGSPVDRVHRLWVQAIDEDAPRPLAGTEYAFMPFWSPDGSAIGFVAYRKLKTFTLATGRIDVICDAPDTGGAAWSEDGTILFSGQAGVLERVDPAGGRPLPVTRLDRSRRERRHVYPQFLPGGRTFLYLALAENGAPGAVYVDDLDAPGRTRVLESEFKARFVPPDWLVFPRDHALMAQRFDPSRRGVAGNAVRLATGPGVLAANGSAAFAVSAAGTIVFSDPQQLPIRQLVWFDRDGRRDAGVGPRGRYVGFDLSPDGRRAAVEVIDEQSRAPDVWVLDVQRGAAVRLTLSPANDERPVWAPDSRHLVYARHRGIQKVADLYIRTLDAAGTEQMLLEADAVSAHPIDWTRDGRFVVFERQDARGGSDLWLMPSGGERAAVPWLRTPYSERQAHVSPDGAWVAYASDESGRSEVYVRRFDGDSEEWAVSTTGGAQPRWSRDGRELFYVSADERIMRVGIETGPAFHADAPAALLDLHRLLAGPYTEAAYAVASDGRLLVLTTVDEPPRPSFTVIVNSGAALGAH